MLPHARPGGIAGLLELLGDGGGRDDLYHLANELGMEADDLLPIIDAAAMLGFVQVAQGDVEMTEAGRAFAEADIQDRKVMFRQAALAKISIFQQIAQALQRKSDRTIPVEFFRDILDEYFSKQEVQRQLETILDWGRYAEIFDYNADSGRLIAGEAETTGEGVHA
jgi:NitT/TauT family transport system ATP-binding protein